MCVCSLKEQSLANFRREENKFLNCAVVLITPLYKEGH